MSSNDWDWNPTFVTPDGEKIETGPGQTVLARHRDPEVLQQLADDGMTVEDMTEELRVSDGVVREKLKKHGIEAAKKEPKHRGDVKVEKFALAGMFEEENVKTCPTCGSFSVTEELQHDCMREHAKEMADELADVPWDEMVPVKEVKWS